VGKVVRTKWVIELVYTEKRKSPVKRRALVEGSWEDAVEMRQELLEEFLFERGKAKASIRAY